MNIVNFEGCCEDQEFYINIDAINYFYKGIAIDLDNTVIVLAGNEKLEVVGSPELVRSLIESRINGGGAWK